MHILLYIFFYFLVHCYNTTVCIFFCSFLSFLSLSFAVVTTTKNINCTGAFNYAVDDYYFFRLPFCYAYDSSCF